MPGPGLDKTKILWYNVLVTDNKGDNIMKAKELKAWVNQLADDEDIYITAMDDNFFEDFECHSIYNDGQAQELILGVYINDYTRDEF